MKVLVLLSLLSVTSVFAGVTLECDTAYGESVYSSFTLTTPINNEYGMPYSLEDYLGQEVVLDGVANPNHPDQLDDMDDWSFVTLGKRSAKIKSDDEIGQYFYIETCKDCDFNSARYQYKKSNDGELFITEMYGSDGSGEFSVYKCEKK